jgi:hypothetical protein
MKPLRQIVNNSFSAVVIVLLPILFFSCNSYNFSEPQPADKENIYEFPESFCGTWIENQDTLALASKFSNNVGTAGKGPSFVIQALTTSLEDELNERDSVWYYIDKKYAQLIIHCREKIAAGAWPRIDEEGDLLDAPFTNTFKRIQFDSMSKPVDTLNNYVIRKNKIFEISEERFLEKGYPFYFDNDTIVVLKYDTIGVDLGQNAFLRKLNDSFYVLNIRNSILGEENVWWRLIVLEKKNIVPVINMWECNSKSADLGSMFFSRSVKNDVFYFDGKWSSVEMLELIRKDYFTRIRR